MSWTLLTGMFLSLASQTGALDLPSHVDVTVHHYEFSSNFFERIGVDIPVIENEHSRGSVSGWFVLSEIEAYFLLSGSKRVERYPPVSAPQTVAYGDWLHIKPGESQHIFADRSSAKPIDTGFRNPLFAIRITRDPVDRGFVNVTLAQSADDGLLAGSFGCGQLRIPLEHVIYVPVRTRSTESGTIYLTLQPRNATSR